MTSSRFDLNHLPDKALEYVRERRDVQGGGVSGLPMKTCPSGPDAEPFPPTILTSHPSSFHQPIESSRILIVDDEPRNVLLLRRVLEAAGFREILSTTDPHEGVRLCTEAAPDLVVLDLHMPELDGYGVMAAISQALPGELYLPILALTADASERAKRAALTLGAKDFLTKPFSVTEVVLRIRNLLETRALYRCLEKQNDDLSQRVLERTRELESARLEVLDRLSQAVEFRDDITGRHTRRVGEQSAALATGLGMEEKAVDLIRRAAPLHDVGKIAIPDAILLKSGKLTDDEFSVMRRHTLFGAEILAGGKSELMATAEAIARSHHERWDGSGYPVGLAAENIPLPARIVAIVDVFDALTTPRHYRQAWTRERAIEEIQRGAGCHFDPQLVRAFLRLLTAGDTPRETTQPPGE